MSREMRRSCDITRDRDRSLFAQQVFKVLEIPIGLFLRCFARLVFLVTHQSTLVRVSLLNVQAMAEFGLEPELLNTGRCGNFFAWDTYTLVDRCMYNTGSVYMKLVKDHALIQNHHFSIQN